MENAKLDKSTTNDTSPDYAPARIMLDVRSGETGTMASWVSAFSEAWYEPAIHLDRLLALLDDNVTLRAPIKPPVTHGKEAARKGFERVFNAIPDLRAEIHRWSSTNDALFIEMTFHATVGGKAISWPNADRVLFENGVAIERVAHFDPYTLRRALTGSLSGLTQLWRLRRG